VVVTREADIIPIAYRVRHDTATMDGVLRNVTGASSSLPTIKLERYSSTGGGGSACTSAASRTL
jgi:hypothetical protein